MRNMSTYLYVLSALQLYQEKGMEKYLRVRVTTGLLKVFTYLLWVLSGL